MRDGRFSLKQFAEELRGPGFRYLQHRHNAELRNIEFKISFEEWWKIWQGSGRWEQRGKGAQRYCMCRVGDEGPYQVGNVFIATNAENLISQRRPNKTLPMGVRQQAKGTFYATRMINRVRYHLGTFSTPELAQAAYKNFSVTPCAT
jgi:hypothetical protein